MYSVMTSLLDVVLDWVRVLLPCVLTFFLGRFVVLRDKVVKSNEEIEKRAIANSEGTRELLRVWLVEFYQRYVVDGEPFSMERKHEVETMYECYHNLGGNGTIKEMYEDLMKVRPYILTANGSKRYLDDK